MIAKLWGKARRLPRIMLGNNDAVLQKQMQAIFDNSTDALFLVDNTTGKIIRSNTRAVELFDVKKEMNFIDQFCISFNKEPVSPVEVAFVLEALKKKGTWEGEVEYMTKDGSSFWGAVSIKLIGIGNRTYKSVRISDITERMLVAERLKKSEAQLAEAQRLVSLGSWNYDYGAKHMTWSEEIYRMFDIDPDVPVLVHQEYWMKYVHPEDRDIVLKGIQKAVEQGYFKFDNRIVRSDGDIKHIEVIVKRVLDEGGKVSGLFGTMRDITDRKLAEEVQRRSEEHIKASLREKELLLAEVHHRVKNNLAVISGLLGLQAGYVKDEEAKELFYESRNRIRSMGLIHDKLYNHETLSRIEFSAYIQDLVSYIRQSYNASETDIRFHLDCRDVFMDIKNAVPCGLILNELVSNAYKHAFKGRNAGEIKISFTQQNDQFRLEVSDNGIGYHPAQKLDEIPTLGLTLITSLVQQLEGRMEMTSTNGTSFIIVFSA
jgi:PAS domain S-box-containing protein